MKWLRNAWYVAAYSTDLADGAIVSRQVLGQPLALWRDASGAAVAFFDRCPHRGAPLSMGRQDGVRLVCGYHGLQFTADGRCVHNPHGNGAIPPKAAVRVYPVVERYGLVWVWPGAAPADVARLPDFPMFEDHEQFQVTHPPLVRMSAPFDYVIDNLLDLSHASYLHEGLLGNEHMIDGADVVVREEGGGVVVTRSMKGRPPPEYFDLLFKNDRQPADAWNNVLWSPPSYVLLDNGCTAPGGAEEEGGRVFAAHLLTPETETTTLYHIVAGRRRPVGVSVDEERVNQRLAELRHIAFVTQDDPMIRAQYERIHMAGDEFRPILLTIDTGVVRWRRLMDRLLAQEEGGLG